jgi:hypothetical protein
MEDQKMSTLSRKYSNMSDAEERKRDGKKAQKKAKEERLRAIREKEEKQLASLGAPQRAKEVIDKIPQIIERKIKEGSRRAIIECPTQYDLGQWRSGIFSAKKLVPSDPANSLVFDYCERQGLKPEFTPFESYRDGTGVLPIERKRPSYIYIQW